MHTHELSDMVTFIKLQQNKKQDFMQRMLIIWPSCTSVAFLVDAMASTAAIS